MFENRTTLIGNGNLIMDTGHIAHGCILEDRNVICNGALLVCSGQKRKPEILDQPN